MALVIKLERSSGASVRLAKGSQRAPDKNCCTLAILQGSGGNATVELNREEATALADALKAAVR